MPSRYAKDQPDGFINKIQKVALVGAGGRFGSWLAKELVKTGKHTVTAVSRGGSGDQLPEGVTAAKVDYDNEASIVAALKGQDILIITLSVRAPPDTHDKLVQAASKAGVPYVIPNAWGQDPLDQQLWEKMGLGKRFPTFLEQCKSLGNITWIAMACGFWYEFSLGGSADRYGFDFKERSVTFIDEGTSKINTSTFAQCGRAMAAFLSLPLLPEDENDERPTIAKCDNKVFHISSFLVSQKDIFESVKRVTGTADSDWKISYEDSAERYKGAVEAWETGDFRGFVRFMYTAVWSPNSGGDYGTPKGLLNEVLALSDEDLDEATREAIRRGVEDVL